MTENCSTKSEEDELNASIEAILKSPAKKKLIIAGPGTGKTTLFKRILEILPCEPNRHLVLTFINNLKDELEKDLNGMARVYTLHSYCLALLYKDNKLRGSLSPEFSCFPSLASIIAEDWKIIIGSEAPQFVVQMRSLKLVDDMDFYLNRGHFYDAVDFDDCVFRVFYGMAYKGITPESYDLVLIDEFQDFNPLEAGIIDLLSTRSPIIIAGDDDQALYGQLRNASWDYIRRLNLTGEFEVFELPFCMRCTKVVVEALSDIIKRAQKLHLLEGRINKSYKHFSLVKGADSDNYPKIINVQTTVQSKKVNYMGRYIRKAISEIPQNEIMESARGGYPVVLIIAVNPYRDQIVNYLESEGYYIDIKRDSKKIINREIGLSMLKQKTDSNLGWRIIIGFDNQNILKDALVQTINSDKRLIDVIPKEYRDSVLMQVERYETPADIIVEDNAISGEKPWVKVTSFEGAKGLSAQHVFIVGLHDSELPRNPSSIKDIEICKFIVGLTRTRKKCTFVHTKFFSNVRKSPSSFIFWINQKRLFFINVDKAYWKK